MADKAADWDTNFKNTPSSSEGEFARPGADAQVADLNAMTFSETQESPYATDGKAV